MLHHGAMICGVGTDIVEIKRMAAIIARHASFYKRLLHADEYARYEAANTENRARVLAKAFAAKEAAAKALGTGFQAGITWRNILIDRDSLGAPTVRFIGASLARFEAVGAVRAHISLADERDYAVATVILEGATPGKNAAPYG